MCIYVSVCVCVVYVCMVHACGGKHANACTYRGQNRMLGVFLYNSHLLTWDRVSHCTTRLVSYRVLRIFSSPPPVPHAGVTGTQACSTFYMGSGVWNSGHHACRASTLTHWEPQLLKLVLKDNRLVLTPIKQKQNERKQNQKVVLEGRAGSSPLSLVPGTRWLIFLAQVSGVTVKDLRCCPIPSRRCVGVVYYCTRYIP